MNKEKLLNKKILSINLGNFGSTGAIAYGIKNTVKKKEIMYCCAYPSHENGVKKQIDDIVISSAFIRLLNEKFACYTGLNGCFAWITTIRFLWKMNMFHPDVLHFHNLHNSYINLSMLFKHIKKNNTNVIWTLHDCWAFTGQCPYFTMVNCSKWKTGCHDCPQYREYPTAYVDRTKTMWKFKKKWFTGIENMTIVTPSQWLADLVKESFLKEYPVKVINNGIDLTIFHPIKNDFREKHLCLLNTYIVLGVAFDWGKRKGLDIFIELAKTLDNNKFQIILVGTDENLDKKLPSNIISIHRTKNQKELAEIYSAADVFVNPTREENYPTVNMEAIACGTPVVTFNTGGSPEIINKECGSVVPCDDIEALKSELIRICEKKPYSQEACLKHAQQFDMNDRFNEYFELYKEIMERKECKS